MSVAKQRLFTDLQRGGITDERSDVYSMGVVLFEAVTGRRPFEGASDFDVMRAQVEKRPQRPRSLRAGVPEAFEEVMLVSLAKHPRDRLALLPHAIAVADAGYHRVQVFSPRPYALLHVWGATDALGRPAPGTGPLEFREPSAIAAGW